MNTEPTTSAPTNDARDERGRFVAGNRGGPGNPFARKVAALRRALIDSVTPQDIQEVAGRLVALPAFFIMVNLASLRAISNLVRGARIERWEPRRDPPPERIP